ncbi:MAG: serine/threonine-protein phosphatase [Armatimonadetes bacterium]|nr:serine/threonine-protein phosphatase [Armatimonadota bacterium]
MEHKQNFAGHRLVEFSPSAKRTMRLIAERLSPYEQAIVEGWVTQQCNAWQPPGFSAEVLNQVFGDIVHAVLCAMKNGELEGCIDQLEQIGRQLADRQFPFDALIISVHFFEETYLPFLLDPPLEQPGKWLVAIDEFLHVALAAISNAYFEAYRKELLDSIEVGQVAQDNLLADIPTVIADLDVAHSYISAQNKARLGGDFLDYFSLDSQTAVFFIGDLSGHGLEAAAESLTLRSLFRGFMREQPDLSVAMQRLNDVVYDDLRPGRFATALAFTYDGNGLTNIVNAGHPPPALSSGEQPSSSGLPLAVQQGATYDSLEVELAPGMVLVAYTDGLIESHGVDGMYGEERLLETVTDMREHTPEAIKRRLLDDSKHFGGGRFADDVAILAIKRSL